MRGGMRIAICAAVVGASACAAIAGLEDPDPLSNAETDAAAAESSAPDASPGDGGPPADAAADAARRCTGPSLKEDSFEGRTDARAGWALDSNTTAGALEIVGGRLHVVVPAAEAGVNVRRQLSIAKPAAKRLCVSFVVDHRRPSSTSGYSGLGDTTFGFVAAYGDGGTTFYHGLQIAPPGLYVYSYRGGANDENRLTTAPLATTWRVFIEADYVSDVLVIGVNEKYETMPFVRPQPMPDVTFQLGIRNFGPTPEAEAYFDDVVITGE